MARGRQPLACERVEINLHVWLRRGEDDDLIQFFESIPPRQRVTALKIALRAGGMRLPDAALNADESIDDLAAELLL